MITNFTVRWLGLNSNECNLSRKSGLLACISSRITMDIHIVNIIVEITTVVMSYSQFCRIKSLYLDLHGLIFETSIWLLAGSTRLVLSLSSSSVKKMKKDLEVLFEKRQGMSNSRKHNQFRVVVYCYMCSIAIHLQEVSRCIIALWNSMSSLYSHLLLIKLTTINCLF